MENLSLRLGRIRIKHDSCQAFMIYFSYPGNTIYALYISLNTTILSGIGTDSVITLNSSPGTITSPDEDSNGLYDHNVDLLWIIEARDSYIIQYQIQALLITNSINCHRDGLTVGIGHCMYFVLYRNIVIDLALQSFHQDLKQNYLCTVGIVILVSFFNI